MEDDVLIRSSFLTTVFSDPLLTLKLFQGYEKPRTAPMVKGSAIHTGCLEPTLFSARYAEKKKGVKREGDACPATNKILLNKDTIDEILLMQHQFENGMKEVFGDGWRDKSTIEKTATKEIDTGYVLSGTPDIVLGDDIIMDLKTVGALPETPQHWLFKCKGYGYGMQFAHYSKILNMENARWINIVQSRSFPFGFKVFELGEIFKAEANYRHEAALKEFIKLVESGQPKHEIQVSDWSANSNAPAVGLLEDFSDDTDLCEKYLNDF